MKNFFGVLIFLATLTAFAQAPLSPEERKKRWEALSPEKKQELRDRYERIRKMPASLQKIYLESYQRYTSLSSAEKAKILKRWEKFKVLPPGKREFYKNRVNLFNQLDEKEKQKKIKEYRQYKRSATPK